MLISYERSKEIADLYYSDIYHFCYTRLKQDEVSADVTQDVFLFFQEHYEELDETKIKAWLLSVANNKIKEEFREIARREKELIYGTVFGSGKSADILYEIEEDNNIPDSVIEKKKQEILSLLTDKELKLFEMFYTKNMEYKEIAEELGISIGATRSRVCRLKNKILEKTYYAFMAILLIFMKL
ncbi:MAG: sigma-70 family RNA polymerase sigma factor [Ruminococcaceae bacterium]|nr:sigma-70 family RNA polymerase sigma factor [Oscillospiraceae bacterium]